MMFFIVFSRRSLANVEVIGILNFTERSDQFIRAGRQIWKNPCCGATQDQAAVNPLLTKKHGIAFVFQRHRQVPNDIAPVSSCIMQAWGGRPSAVILTFLIPCSKSA
jgi:hypothetical protein